MISRNITPHIKDQLGKYPIIALTGPRQSGKTTLLSQSFSEYRYVSLENPDNRSFAIQDPKGFLAEYDQKVIFDEIQQAPELFSYMQEIVDKRGQMGQFIISGSQNFHLIEKITQSLAGRVAMFRLFPFDLSEMKNANWLAENKSTVISKGFYPAIFERKINQDRYYADYLSTYVNRDISQLINVHDESGFNAFIKLCASRAGQLLNYSDLARDAGVSHATAKRWLSILQSSFIVFLLNPYFKNYSKRIVKSSKLYFYDVGLLCHLLGFRDANFDQGNSHWGNVFENMIVSELIKQNHHQDKLLEYYYWRESEGREVDLLYSLNQQFHLYEIKSTSTITSKLFKNMDHFEKIAEETVAEKNLVYGGDSNQKRTEYQVFSWKNVK